MFHVSYTILGLGLIISQSIYLFNIVKWCGVAYLVYIGIKALRAGRTEIEAPVAAGAADGRRQPALRAFGLGFMANALNPKAVFFFLSIFSTVVSAHTPIMVKFESGRISSRSRPLYADRRGTAGRSRGSRSATASAIARM